jgi:hypothetical protein
MLHTASELLIRGLERVTEIEPALSAWELYGAVRLPPADSATCANLDGLTVSDHDYPRGLLPSGTFTAPEAANPISRICAVYLLVLSRRAPRRQAHSAYMDRIIVGGAFRPSAFQAGHIPSCRESCECPALSSVAGARRWSLRLLSPLLSAEPRLCDAVMSDVIDRSSYDLTHVSVVSDYFPRVDLASREHGMHQLAQGRLLSRSQHCSPRRYRS